MAKTCPVCGVTYPDSNIFCLTDGTTLRAADTDGDLIGSVIADRYLVTDLLGEGGMGKVYLARHVRLPQQAAIKVMRAEQMRDASAIARFNREAANASRIDHDRVARVYDFGETGDGIVYLAMEFVAGRTLKAILAERGPMPPGRAANVIRQIADGLDAAHRLGIVHRDLKPDNVLVIEGEATDGSDDRVKVVDFGIAKALGSDSTGEPGLTRTGFVVGTPEFMSPEQLLGGAIDARSDVYALAILAYQCLTGHLPFDTNSADRGMTARLMEPARALAVVRQDVPWPASVQSVFDAGLAREPQARPATAGAFARLLASAVDAWNVAASVPPAAPDALPSTSAPSAPAPLPPAPLAAAPFPTAPFPTAPPQQRPSNSALPTAPSPAPSPPAPSPPPARARRAAIGISAGAVTLAAAAALLFARRTPSTPEPVPTASAPNATAPVVTVPTAPATSAPATTTATSPAPAVTAATRPTASSPAPSSRALPRAANAGSATTTAPPAATPPAPAGPGASGRHTLDSITASIDPSNPDPAAGRAAANALRTLLPRLTTANDSAWALVRTIEANLMAGDQGRACTAMRSARTAARSDAQREAVRRYEQAVECP